MRVFSYGRGHFRSRDKDGGHTIRSIMAENSTLHANITDLSSMQTEVSHGGNIDFRTFLLL